MPGPVYKLWMVRMTEAAYKLSQDEQGQMLAKVDQALTKVGGTRLISCDSTWSTDQWHYFGIEEYPNIEAVQQHTGLLQELNWFGYIDSVSVLGTKNSMVEPKAPAAGTTGKPVYKVFCARNNDAWQHLSNDEQQKMFARNLQAQQQVGSRILLLCDTAWAGEQWSFFGIQEFPDVGAAQTYARLLQEMNWYRYAAGLSILGTKAEGM